MRHLQFPHEQGHDRAVAPDGVTWFPVWAVSNDNYHVSSSDGWSNRGWNAACTLQMEFTKLWNSFYLIQNGILDNNSNSWHGREDYPFVAQGNVSNFHNEFFYKATDETGISYFHINVFGDNEVVVECGSFNPGYFGDGAVRASSIIHEGWHAWQYHEGLSIDHPYGKDYFYPHGVSAYPFGQMHNINIGKHSPGQAEYEFDCDIYISSMPWVTNQIKAASLGEGNRLADSAFVNANGSPLLAPHCEAPRPWTIP
jgi:hypothetical protein